MPQIFPRVLVEVKERAAEEEERRDDERRRERRDVERLVARSRGAGRRACSASGRRGSRASRATRACARSRPARACRRGERDPEPDPLEREHRHHEPERREPDQAREDEERREERERQEHEHAAGECAGDGDRTLRRERDGADVREAASSPPTIGTSTSRSVSSRTRASRFSRSRGDAERERGPEAAAVEAERLGDELADGPLGGRQRRRELDTAPDATWCNIRRGLHGLQRPTGSHGRSAATARRRVARFSDAMTQARRTSGATPRARGEAARRPRAGGDVRHRRRNPVDVPRRPARARRSLARVGRRRPAGYGAADPNDGADEAMLFIVGAPPEQGERRLPGRRLDRRPARRGSARGVAPPRASAALPPCAWRRRSGHTLRARCASTGNCRPSRRATARLRRRECSQSRDLRCPTRAGSRSSASPPRCPGAERSPGSMRIRPLARPCGRSAGCRSRPGRSARRREPRPQRARRRRRR